MKLSTREQGIGIIATIFIVAIIAVGGVAAVQIAKKTNINAELNEAEMMDEAQEEIAEAKQEAQVSLMGLKSRLNVSGNVAVALDAVAEVKADLGAVYVNADAEAKAEFAAIMTRLDKLEADIEARADSAAASLDAVIETISVSMTEELFVDDTTSESEVNAENETDITATSSNDGVADVDASTEADATITADDMDVTSELETTSTVIVE